MESCHIEAVGPENREGLLDYCRAHRGEHDDSWLSEPDLGDFGEHDRAWVLRRGAGGGEILGAISVMLDPASRERGLARLRIFHSAGGRGEDYRMLFEAARSCCASIVPRVYAFLPGTATAARAVWESLGFSAKRHSWVLDRPLGPADAQYTLNYPVDPDPLNPSFLIHCPSDLPTVEASSLRPPASHCGLPPGLRLLRAGLRDPAGGLDPVAAPAWCSIINEAFAALAGHNHLDPEGLERSLHAEAEFADSYIFLLAEESLAGLACTLVNLEEPHSQSATIGPIAVFPAFQGRGYGRILLRAAIGVANGEASGVANGEASGVANGEASGVANGEASVAERRFQRVDLSVNAENGKALALYLSEGFSVRECFTCYEAGLNDSRI